MSDPLNYPVPADDNVPHGMESGLDIDHGLGGQERDANRNNCGYP